MNPTIKAKWIAALRSGEYGQGRARLRSISQENYCCLGVLCDIHAKETDTSWEYNHYLDQSMVLPRKVISWAGLIENNPQIPGKHSLAYENDHGASFTEIAQLIEENL